MEEGFVDINNVSTRIVTFGGWINQPLQSSQLIIVIPGTFFFFFLLHPILNKLFHTLTLNLFSGNPGLIGYYETFMAALHENLQGKFVIWGIGHGGHEKPSSVDLPCINSNNHIINSFDHLALTLNNNYLQRIQIYLLLMVKSNTRSVSLTNMLALAQSFI